MARDLARHFKPGTFLYKFFDEKDISRRGFDVTDSQGLSHDIPLEVVLEAIAGTRGMERRKIEETLRQIDFRNGDVRHFLEHLAKGLAEQYSGALRFAYTVPREGYRVKGVGLPVRGRIVEKVGPFWDGGDFVVVERDVSGLRGQQDPYMYAVVDRRGTMTHFFGTIPSKGHGRKFYERHNLGPSRMAFRVAHRWLNAGFDRDVFDFEGKDFGVQVRRSWGDDSVYLYYPLENIGRRGRTVTKIGANFRADPGGVAWAHTYLDRVKKVSNARAAVKLLDDTVKEARSRGGDGQASMWDRELKGVDKSLPTPTSQKIDDIVGRNIRVDVNTKPMRVYDANLADELEKSYQRYTFEIPHRFKKQVHAIRDDLAAAKSYKEVEKILDANKIRYRFDIHMDPMYQ